jgi:hypothetical protein
MDKVKEQDGKEASFPFTLCQKNLTVTTKLATWYERLES